MKRPLYRSTIMKINSILLFLIFSTLTVGQIPFSSTQAIWVNTVYSILEQQGAPPQHLLSQVENLCLSDKDTIIYGKKYKKLRVCAGPYRGAIRQAGQRVYFIPPGAYLEYILYDFGVNIGDVISNVYMEEASNYGLPVIGQLEVEAIDYAWIGGEYRKRIHFQGAQGGRWIEGVGCTRGFLKSPFSSNLSVLNKLECMSENDTSRYPVLSLHPCNLPTLSPVNYYVDIYAEVKNGNGDPLPNYAVYIGGGSGQGGEPLKKLITGPNGKIHDSLIPGNTPSLYAYVYDCFAEKVMDFEIAMANTESDSTHFKFVLTCPGDTCDVVLSHSLVDADASLFRFEYEAVGDAPQSANPTWTFSDGEIFSGKSGIERIVEPGNFTYCVDLGCGPSTCQNMYADPNCRAEFFLDTVNSIVFNGNIIFWKNTKPGTQYSYEWNFGDGAISNSTYPVHSYSASGHYNICLTITYNDGVKNCTHTFCDTIFFEKAHLTFQVMDPALISVEDPLNDQDQYTIFPNPASEEFTISWNEHEKMIRVLLYEINGHLVREWPGVAEGKQIIRLDDIPAGTYIIKAIMQDAAKTVPLIVE